jgi:hypothetical protein
MYHSMVSANEKDIITNNGLMPLVTGILSKVRAQYLNYNFQVVSVDKDTVRFGTEVGLPLFNLETTKMNDNLWQFSINSVDHPISGQSNSQTISSKNAKYIINKIKNADHIEHALKLQDELFTHKGTNEMARLRWSNKTIKKNHIRQLNVNTQLELIKVYLGNKQANQMDDADDYAIKETYKNHMANIAMEDMFVQELSSFMNQSRFVWYKNHTLDYVMAGKINPSPDVWDIPLALYKSEDEIPPEIRNPVLARLTMASMLRRKTFDLKYHDVNKLYPAYPYWDKHKIDEMEVFGELETLIDLSRSHVTLVMMTAK